MTDDDGVRTFERIRQEADKFPPPYDPTPGRFFDSRVLNDGHRLWLGHMHDEPVATVATFGSNGLNLIKNVSTATEFSGRGIG